MQIMTSSDVTCIMAHNRCYSQVVLQIDAGEFLTIDQLAQQSGMTVRSIRAHQARGLIPPPELRGRTGYYDQEHLARVRLVQDLQAEGLNLDAIKRLMDRTPAGAAAQALAMRQSLLHAWEEEEPVSVEREQLAGALGPAQPGLIEEAERLGLIRRDGDDRYQVTSPTLLRVAQELVGEGLSLEAVLRVQEKLQAATDEIARVFVSLFEEEVWRPFDDQGRPADRWAQVAQVMERTRPLAGEATIANLRRSMGRAVEESVARDFEL